MKNKKPKYKGGERVYKGLDPYHVVRESCYGPGSYYVVDQYGLSNSIVYEEQLTDSITFEVLAEEVRRNRRRLDEVDSRQDRLLAFNYITTILAVIYFIVSNTYLK